MSCLYICTLMFLGIAFMCYKKSDKQLNFVKWICIFAVGILGYNVTVCMILGVLHIVQNIWLLSAINTIIGTILIYKPIKNREFQKYKCSKMDAVTILLICVVFGVMFVKDLYIFKGDVTHWAIDSAIHYRAAEQYSEELQLFVFAEDKTFFNFNIMQTGAYINDGIFMNVLHSITGLEYSFIFQIFETLTMFIGGLAFYAFFATKIKTKKGLIASLALFGLYIYGYPYNSWIYGFSYLSVGIAMTALLLSVVESVYSDEKIRKIVTIPLVVITAIGLIFSYCLFVPAIFAAICIFCFLKDLSDKNAKKYLKFFGKTTLIITGLLLLVTASGIGYLFIPSFFIEGQTNLISALKIGGELYEEKYVNFIPYIPFAILYFAEIIKRIKNKSLRYQDVFSVIIVGYTALLYLGMLAGFVSPYYMLKTYFIMWIGIFSAMIDLVNTYLNEKIIRIDAILIFVLYAFLIFRSIVIKKEPIIDMWVILKLFVCLMLALFTVLPELVKYIDLTKFKKIPEKFRKRFEIKSIKISVFTYVIIWTVFVCGWVWIKAGHVVAEEEKHRLPNYVGIYFEENCDRRKRIDMNNSFNANEVETALFARENLKDMTVENTQL